MALAGKYLNHPSSQIAWREANEAILLLIERAARCDRKRAKDIYDAYTENFMNQLVDDLHKLYIIAHDK